MIDEKVEGWIQREIDGEIDPADFERLRQTLARDPEARDLHARMERLADQLGQVEIVDPPADLKSEIMRGLPESVEETKTATTRRVSSPGLHVPRKGIRRRDVATFLCGAAMAAAVVAAIFVGERATELDPATLMGTMRPDADAGSWRAIDQQRVVGPGLTGSASTRTASGWVEVTLDLESAHGTAVTLTFDETALVPTGFEHTRVSIGELAPDPAAPAADMAVGSFSARPGRVHFQHSGSSAYRIVLRSRSEKEDSIPANLQLNASESALHVSLRTRPAVDR
jgi:hypothetical protein